MSVLLFLGLFLCGCRCGHLTGPSPHLPQHMILPLTSSPHILVVWPCKFVGANGGLGRAGGVGGRGIEGRVPRSLGAVLCGWDEAAVGGVGQCLRDSVSVREVRSELS